MTAPARLLWLVDSLGAGGAEALVVTYAEAVRGKQPFFVACLSGADGVNAQRLQALDVPVIDLRARNLRDVAAFRRLLAAIREHRIELIHAHLTYSSIWSAIASRLTGVPAIASLHVSPRATRTLKDSALHRVATDLRDRLMRAILNRWSRLVVMVSGALRDDYLARGLRAAKIRVVHNGIELDRFRRPREESRARLERELDIPSGVPIVATVAVLRPKKGIEVLLEAAPKVRNALFVIIGDGPLREEWTRLAASLGVADRVRWAGYRKDVDALLAGCDLFVHPSLDDAFPTVLLEAMAAGLPIVASRVGGIPEIVTPGVTGELVPPGDAPALAAAINALLGSADTMRLMRAAAESHASRFSTAAWIERLTAVYRECAA
ncbi:MAG TPA: glycosyltransferase [Thermoanaerobaculia bacterium]|nr:glycosyltransferase [Thermoanaerobaculia bacterium]